LAPPVARRSVGAAGSLGRQSRPEASTMRLPGATTSKITPAIRENVFASTSDHPKLRSHSRGLRTCSERFGHQNGREPVTTGRHRTGRTVTCDRFSQYQSILVGTERNGPKRPPPDFESGASTNSATGGARLSVNGPIPLPLRIAIWAQAAGRRGRSSGPRERMVTSGMGFFSEPKLRSGRSVADRDCSPVLALPGPPVIILIKSMCYDND
jgi:hypothetical protein